MFIMFAIIVRLIADVFEAIGMLKEFKEAR